jgi:hypothetical protein
VLAQNSGGRSDSLIFAQDMILEDIFVSEIKSISVI